MKVGSPATDISPAAEVTRWEKGKTRIPLLGRAFDRENRSPSCSPVLCLGLPLCHCPPDSSPVSFHLFLSCGALFKEMLPTLSASLAPPAPVRGVHPHLALRRTSVVAWPLMGDGYGRGATALGMARQTPGLASGTALSSDFTCPPPAAS